MNGERVATWSVRGTAHTLRYEPSWLASPRCRPLSLSLPIAAGLRLDGPVVRNWFDNLLPDNADIRERLRRRHRAAGTDAFNLLAAIGRDCVGAVQLLPPDAEPRGFDRLDHDPLDDEAVEQHLDDMLAGTPFGRDEDEAAFRISIAGAQEKTALLRVGERWCRPRGATPTTHILKLPLGLVGGLQLDMRDSVENEWLCLKLLGAMGLPAAACDIATFGARKVLVVERFDRQWMDAGRWIARLPQEDLCQASGTAPGDKYEDQGGPGMERCLRLLSGSSDAQRDRGVFLLAQLAFWLLAATDGHAKNFSIFLAAGGGYRMTPLYDVLSAWTVEGPRANQVRAQKMRLAMALRTKNAHYRLADIQPRHWLELADREAPGLRHTMVDMAQGVTAAVARVEAMLPEGFPGAVWEVITGRLVAQAEKFLRGTG
uniref:type II toxin-antitoxin system HipA family toxin n=1 Tax=Azohydromonas aeria TaxID=2590212 RepID=UPI0012FAD935|nr:type II toxin-antitoxin system HipA family toxin [Azohydromonas aeria]